MKCTHQCVAHKTWSQEPLNIAMVTFYFWQLEHSVPLLLVLLKDLIIAFNNFHISLVYETFSLIKQNISIKYCANTSGYLLGYVIPIIFIKLIFNFFFLMFKFLPVQALDSYSDMCIFMCFLHVYKMLHACRKVI